jgi:hypothetical protein
MMTDDDCDYVQNEKVFGSVRRDGRSVIPIENFDVLSRVWRRDRLP